jgi:hypothetical protein
VEALVVGAYPSAFHVAWTPPHGCDLRDEAMRTRPLIAALAVDVEPVVFWDGLNPSPAVELQRWMAAVAFDQTRHGVVRPARNGPSGTGVTDHVLGRLDIDISSVAFTDVVPWYFVKRGVGSQGEAMASRFAPVAERLGVHPGSLPTRPSRRQLVEIAASAERRDALRAEIIQAEAPLVVTLGQEALDALRDIADEVAGVQSRLAPNGYGEIGYLRVDGRRYDLLPLVHPGFRRQTSDPRWVDAFEAWSDATPSA